MISPAEIRQKAGRLYPQAIQAWLCGDTAFFPRRLPAKLQLPAGTPQSEVIRQVAQLREHSKARLGYGYTVHYQQINKRLHGDNLYPSAIEIDSLDDLLRLTRKQTEFRALVGLVERLRARLPQLDDWHAQNWKRLLPLAEFLDDLILVVEYLRDHPRPACYVRELPLPVSSKLIEQNKPLLRDWLDRVLPPAAIDFGCDHREFEQRYGFRFQRQHIWLRLLDPQLRHELGLPCEELSLPADDIARLCAAKPRVYVVENKINLLTLPRLADGLALGGLGNNLADFEKIPWLTQRPIYYWGDLDVDGFVILARFRRLFPQTRSLLMDLDTLTTHQALWTKRLNQPTTAEPAELQPTELAAFRYCRDQAIRLEQEHIPQAYVNAQLGL